MIDPQERMSGSLKALLVANVAVFVAGLLSDMLGSRLGGLLFQWGALVPDLVWSHSQFWRVFSYMFLHAGAMHLLFNMLTLWMFGTSLVWAMGSRRFLALYFVSGLVAGICSAPFYIFGGGGGTAIVGASGALFGVMLGFARYFPTARIIVFFLFPMQARHAVWLFGGISLLFAMAGGGGVAHATHLFGILGGWLYLRFEEPVANWLQRIVTRRERLRVEKAAEELVTREEYFDTRVDPILKKISRHGVESLTRQEREVLERARNLRRASVSPEDVERWRRERGR